MSERGHSMGRSASIVEALDEMSADRLGGAPLLSRDMRSAFFKTAMVTLAGALLSLAVIDIAPRRYEAEVRLTVDGAGEAALADAAEAIVSKASLDSLAHALNLGREGEFAVDRSSASLVVSEIVTGAQTTVSQAEDRLREKLRGAIRLNHSAGSGQFTISVTSEQPADAARIANMLGKRLADEIAASRALEADPLVEKLRRTLERAEAELSGLLSGIDEQKLAEVRRSLKDAQNQTSEIAETEAQLVDLKQKAAEAAAMKLEDVLNKPLPDGLEYTALDYRRQRYVEAKLAADQLAGNLGPRHPRLMVAQSAVRDSRSEIQTALKQLVASLRQQEASSVRRLADLKTAQKRKPDDKEIVASAARLEALESAVGEARENYLTALHRSETEPNSFAAKVGVVTAADAKPLGFSPLAISGGGSLIGLCLGVALAFLTRRKPSHEPEIDEVEPIAHQPEVVDLEWEDDLPEQAGDFDDRYEPASHELGHHEDGYHREPQPAVLRYPPPVNHTPLGDHIRDMLIANRRPVQDAGLPPPVAAVMAGRVSQSPDYAKQGRAEEEAGKAEELRELRRHMAELRERVEAYSANRSARR